MSHSSLFIYAGRLTAVVLLWCAWPAALVNAGQWRFAPRITKQETWSDNINQASSGLAKSDYITQVSPGIGITGTGAKLKLSFDYGVDLLHYLHGTSDNTIDQRLQTTANAELLDQLLFLDINATAGQQNTNSTGTLANNNLTVSSNTSNFLTYDISPFLRHHLGSFADSEIRYRRQQANNEGAIDTEVNALKFDVQSGRRFKNLPWTVTAEVRRDSNSDDTSTTFRNVDSSLRYNFSRRYGVRLNVGYEDNAIRSTRGDTKGLTWALTGIWTPTPRTDFEAGYGRKFFGNNFNIQINHRMRRSIVNVSYAEEATTTAAQQLNSNLFPLNNAFGNPIVNPGVNNPAIPIDRATISNDVIITKRLDAGLTMSGRRNNYAINLFDERRTFESGAGSEQVFGMNARATRTLSHLSSADLSFDWQRNDQAGGNEVTQWNFNVGYNHTFFRDFTTNLNYQRSQGSSNVAGNGFKENRFSANLRWLF